MGQVKPALSAAAQGGSFNHIKRWRATLNNSENTSPDPVKRSLVLGGRGFIGTHLIDALLDQGHFVRCFDRPNVAPLGESHFNHPNFELCEGDFTSEAEVAKALEGCDVCYHLVSTTLPKSSNADPVFDVESNVVATIRLLNLAVKSGLRKIVFISSGGTVYGDPTQVKPMLLTRHVHMESPSWRSRSIWRFSIAYTVLIILFYVSQTPLVRGSAPMLAKAR